MSKEIKNNDNKNIVISQREKILTLEKALIEVADGKNIVGDGKEVVHHEKYKYKHTFGDGTYIREMFIPKGDAVIGAIHKHLHVWILLSGHIRVATEDSTEEYKAPCTVLSTPGVKRVIYAVEDSVFTNIHKNPSNTKDIKKLEKEIVALNYEEYEKYINKK